MKLLWWTETFRFRSHLSVRALVCSRQGRTMLQVEPVLPRAWNISGVLFCYCNTFSIMCRSSWLFSPFEDRLIPLLVTRVHAWLEDTLSPSPLGIRNYCDMISLRFVCGVLSSEAGTSESRGSRIGAPSVGSSTLGISG